jgi:hypothetical protein
MATAVPPPPPPGPTPATPAPIPAATVTVPNPPPGLSQLALGARIEAIVQGQGGSGQVQVQTPVGPLTVQTGIPLPAGSTLVLQFLSLAPQAQFQLNSIDGNPVLQGARPTATANPSLGLPSTATGSGAPTVATGGGAAAGATAGQVSLTVGTAVTATLLGPTTTGAPTLGGTPLAGASATGAQGALQAPASGTPGASTAPVPAGGVGPPGPAVPGIATPPTGIGTPAASAPGGVAGVQAGTQAGHVAGSQLTVRIAAAQPPVPGAPVVSPPAGPTNLVPGTTLAATVTGTTATGHPVVQTASGSVSLATPTPLPTGTTLNLEVISRPHPPTPAAMPSLHAREGLVLSREWPALKEAMATLQQTDPAAAQQLIDRIMPQPDARLSTSMLFFLAALRGGTIQGWLGDGIARALQRSRPDILSRLGDDFSALQRMGEEAPGRDWRMMPIPLYGGAEIDQIRMLMRRHGGERDEDDDETGPRGGIRFVLDVDLSRLGRMQLDGLVREKDKRFDLIVRSDQPFPGPVQNDIRAIFEDAIGASGTKGGLAFQSMPAEFVEISDDDEPRPGVVV